MQKEFKKSVISVIFILIYCLVLQTSNLYKLNKTHARKWWKFKDIIITIIFFVSFSVCIHVILHNLSDDSGIIIGNDDKSV